jgi:hypothetical protein
MLFQREPMARIVSHNQTGKPLSCIHTSYCISTWNCRIQLYSEQLARNQGYTATPASSATAAAAAATAGRGAMFEITRGGKPRMRIVAGTNYNITVSKQRHPLLTSWQHSTALCCSAHASVSGALMG